MVPRDGRGLLFGPGVGGQSQRKNYTYREDRFRLFTTSFPISFSTNFPVRFSITGVPRDGRGLVFGPGVGAESKVKLLAGRRAEKIVVA